MTEFNDFMKAVHIVYRRDEEMRSEGKKGLIPRDEAMSIESLIVACKLCEKRSIVTSPSRTT